MIKKLRIAFTILYFLCIQSFEADGQFQTIELIDSSAVRVLKGILLMPDEIIEKIPLVVIIAGSGQTGGIYQIH